jgi:hypothetical protein
VQAQRRQRNRLPRWSGCNFARSGGPRIDWLAVSRGSLERLPRSAERNDHSASKLMIREALIETRDQRLAEASTVQFLRQMHSGSPASAQPVVIGFRQFAAIPFSGAFRWLECPRFVGVNQNIELLGQAHLEVMTPPFGFGAIDTAMAR